MGWLLVPGNRSGASAASGSVVREGSFPLLIQSEPRTEEVVVEETATPERLCHLDTYFKVTWRRKAECGSEETTKTSG